MVRNKISLLWRPHADADGEMSRCRYDNPNHRRRERKRSHETTRTPSAITDHNQPRPTLIAIEDHEKFSRPADDPRRVLDLANLPETDANWVDDALDELILDEDRV